MQHIILQRYILLQVFPKLFEAWLALTTIETYRFRYLLTIGKRKPIASTNQPLVVEVSKVLNLGSLNVCCNIHTNYVYLCSIACKNM